MQAYRLTLTEADVARIRTVAEMVFAHDFAPDAFSSYIDVEQERPDHREAFAGA